MKNFIDERNKVIWDKVTLSYNVELNHQRNQKGWNLEITADTAFIIAPENDFSKSSFTHELLHIYLTVLGRQRTMELLKTIEFDKNFNVFLKNNLLGYSVNVLDHVKMKPLFLKMGYDSQSFLTDRISINNSTLKWLFFLSKVNPESIWFVNTFIGKTLSFLCHSEDNCIDKNRHLNKLESINPSLFSIVFDFVNEWRNSDNVDLLQPFILFNEELYKWFQNK